MNILVTTDGSERSLCILPHAARFAAALDAKLTLLRVLDPRTDAADVVAPSVNVAVATVRDNWKQEMRSVLVGHGVQADVLVAERKWGEAVAETIHRAADDLPAAMLAMASRGRGAIKHAILGSVSLDVVARADLPVMVLTDCPETSRDGSQLHLLVTYDGSADARSVFGGLAPILVPGKTKVTLVEIAVMAAQETESEAEDRVRGPLERLASRLPDGVDCDIAIRVVPPAAGIDTAIANLAKELGVDAIASATHGHSARRHLVAGSVVLGVVKLAEVPVILVKSHAAD